MSEEAKPLDTWAVLELMGHRKLAGRVSEEVRFGSVMCRIDVPDVGDVAAFTQYYGGSSIYALTPVSEQIARGVAANLKARPIDLYDLSALMRDKEAAQRRIAYDPDEDDDGYGRGPG